ncbi:MAG: hypothetical protein IJJ44_07910 [Solobacterium sp.]|nr:hypothetical protein [Solobacterium sp.]
MDLRKGLSYVAFGFLFTLINFNLTVNGQAISITPNFIGWILFFLSFNELGKYVRGKDYLKWCALVLAVLSGISWGLGIVKPELSIDKLNSVTNLIAAVFMFMFLGIMVQIAEDYHSSRASTLRTLRVLNFALEIGLSVIGLFITPETVPAYAVIILVAGLVLLIAAIITCITLFGLRKDITEA